MSERQPERDVIGTVRPVNLADLLPDLSKLSRYDLLLAAIPFVLLGAALIGRLATVPLWMSLSVGALAALPMLVDGVALNPPT